MTGHEKESAYSMLIGALVGLFVSIGAVPALGATGAGLGQAATLVTWNAIAVTICRRKLGVWPGVSIRRSA
jgi:O-antigen/teichoic acid export membrane protein